MSTHHQSSGYNLADRVRKVQAELKAMRSKEARLRVAIRQKSTHLLRLEASQALGGDQPQSDINHVC